METPAQLSTMRARPYYSRQQAQFHSCLLFGKEADRTFGHVFLDAKTENPLLLCEYPIPRLERGEREGQ
jgi:hypothetical protein